MSASSLCSLGRWSALTLDSAGRGCVPVIATGLSVAPCSFPAPSRELDVPVPSMTSRSGRCSGSSTHVSLNSLCRERLWRPLQAPEAPAQPFRDIAVWFAGNLSNISLVMRIHLVMIGGSISNTSVTSGDHGVPSMLSTNSVSHLSCRTVLHLITPEGVPMSAWPSNDLQPR